jgi:hypothetical protein
MSVYRPFRALVIGVGFRTQGSRPGLKLPSLRDSIPTRVHALGTRTNNNKES